MELSILKDIDLSTYVMDADQVSSHVSCWTDTELDPESVHPVANMTLEPVIRNLRARLNNLEVFMREEQKQTTFKIANVDSIDETEVGVFNLYSQGE